MNWNFTLTEKTAQAAIQEIGKQGLPESVVALLTAAVNALPESAKPVESKPGEPTPVPAGLVKDIQITSNGNLDFADGAVVDLGVSHLTIVVGLVPAGVTIPSLYT